MAAAAAVVGGLVGHRVEFLDAPEAPLQEGLVGRGLDSLQRHPVQGEVFVQEGGPVLQLACLGGPGQGEDHVGVLQLGPLPGVGAEDLAAAEQDHAGILAGGDPDRAVGLLPLQVAEQGGDVDEGAVHPLEPLGQVDQLGQGQGDLGAVGEHAEVVLLLGPGTGQGEPLDKKTRQLRFEAGAVRDLVEAAGLALPRSPELVNEGGDFALPAGWIEDQVR